MSPRTSLVLHGREVYYVVEERAAGRPPLVSDVGVRLPAQITASGRAILAGLPAAQVRALFPDRAAFVHAARHRTGQPERPHLDARPRPGGAATPIEDGDVTPGMSSVAVAVTDHVGHPVAAVAVTFETGSVTDVADVVARVARDRRCADPPPRRPTRLSVPRTRGVTTRHI